MYMYSQIHVLASYLTRNEDYGVAKIGSYIAEYITVVPPKFNKGTKRFYPVVISLEVKASTIGISICLAIANFEINISH